MARVVLVQPPYQMNLFLQGLGWLYPQMSLPYLAAALERAGHEAWIIDPQPQRGSVADVVESALSTEPDVVGLTGHTAEFPAAYVTAQAIRREAGGEVLIALGGAHATLAPSTVLAPEDSPFDVCCVGDGEETVVELARVADGEARLARVPGIWWRDREDIRRNPSRPRQGCLDSLPFPLLSGIDGFPSTCAGFADLGISWTLCREPVGPQLPFIPIVASRGCNYRCAFCSVHTKDGGWRGRSPRAIVSEIEARWAEYGIRDFYFVEDMFSTREDTISELVSLLADRGLDIRWNCFTRPDWVCRNTRALELMRRAGCDDVYIGAESLSEETLLWYRKGVLPEHFQTAVDALKQLDFSVTASFILAGPKDDPAAMAGFRDSLLRSGLDYVQLFLFAPLPGASHGRSADLSQTGWRALQALDAQHPDMSSRDPARAALWLEIRDSLHTAFYTRREWCKQHVAASFDFRGRQLQRVTDTLFEHFRTQLPEALRVEGYIRETRS